MTVVEGKSIGPVVLPNYIARLAGLFGVTAIFTSDSGTSADRPLSQRLILISEHWDIIASEIRTPCRPTE